MKSRKRLFSKIWDMPYGCTNSFSTFDAAKNSKEFVQKLQLQIKIPVHNGCVNSICWNDNGKYLLSGSDDQRLSIVHGYDYSVLAYIQTGHRANIFSAKFLPNSGDSHVVSCSGDGIIIYSNLERPETSLMNKFNCHRGTAYEIMTVPNDPNTFLSCGEDRTVRWFDLRTKTSCSSEDCKDDVLINCRSPVTSLAVNPLTPYQLAVGCADASVQLFDRRMLATQATAGNFANNGFQALMTCFTVPEFTQSRRITSLCYSADGQEMLVSYSSDYIYLFDIRDDLDKKPRLLSRNPSSNGSDSDSGFFFRGPPLMKRLRVRGDWSDTGPNARPEAELRETQETSSQANIVRRMTDILTRMFNSSAQRSLSTPSRSSSDSSHASSHSEDGDVDGMSDSNDEEGDERNTETKDAKNETKSQASQTNTGLGCSSKSASTSDNRTSMETPTTCTSAFEQDKLGLSSDDSVSQPSTSGRQLECENKTGIADEPRSESSIERTLTDSVNLSFQNIEEKLEEEKSDLVEKHNSEPVMNHNAGQDVNSTIITMDVPSSSTANESQLLEQRSDISDAPTPQVSEGEQSVSVDMNDTHVEQASSESETEAAVQTVEPSVMVGITDDDDDDSPQQETAQLGMRPSGGEVELMMEVDSWDADSDDDAQPHTSQTVRSSRRATRDRLRENLLSSLEDELDSRLDESQKEEPRLVNVTQPRVKRKFTGHRNARTMIKESTFWGDNFIMSGSDCGHIFIWDRHTAELVMLMEADHHVVNCLQPHPFDPILASSGIDYDIKLWAPLREEPFFDEEKATEIIKRNEIMLEETKDTITVPASFMFRMLATLNHFRTGRALRWSVATREMRNANSDSSTR